jgi:stearoyl-CoA desaturase (delta-9 desaturase)
MEAVTDITEQTMWRWKSAPFFAVHLAAAVGVAWLGWSWRGLALAVGLYYVRMFFVTGFYHRYFSHRTFRTSRPMQLVLAVLAMTSSQKGVLWWASHHRIHHKYSDVEGDVHSVLREGFLWGHLGWILSRKYENTDSSRVRDLEKYPELVWLDRFWWLPPAAFAVGLFAIGGTFALVWGFFVSTSLLWHGTFTINSLSHMFGSRRYATSDNSRNNPLLAAITLGEGWHNNHHHYQRSVRQGFFWWELDPTYYALRGMAMLGLIWDLHTPPPHAITVMTATAAVGSRAGHASSSASVSVSSSVSSAPAAVAALSTGLRVPDATLEG